MEEKEVPVERMTTIYAQGVGTTHCYQSKGELAGVYAGITSGNLLVIVTEARKRKRWKGRGWKEITDNTCHYQTNTN